MEESGAEEVLGGAAAGEGNTREVTSKDADVAGAGSCHGAEKKRRERVAGWKENPSGKSSGVGIREVDPEASRVAENPRYVCQGVGGEV